MKILTSQENAKLVSRVAANVSDDSDSVLRPFRSFPRPQRRSAQPGSCAGWPAGRRGGRKPHGRHPLVLILKGAGLNRNGDRSNRILIFVFVAILS